MIRLNEPQRAVVSVDSCVAQSSEGRQLKVAPNIAVQGPVFGEVVAQRQSRGKLVQEVSSVFVEGSRISAQAERNFEASVHELSHGIGKHGCAVVDIVRIVV